MAATLFETSTPSARAAIRSLRVLYADDVPELRELARLAFSRDGHRIECAEDGRIALNRMERDSNFDLVITDHHMPNMNGLEFVQGLRELHFPGRIIVFSSELNPNVATQYRLLGVDRILAKPIYPSALRAVIGELFGSAPMRQ